jgi:DNA-binding CsgD family transcriptional regulator
MWRGRLAADVGDTEGMRSQLGRAVALAEEQGRPAAACEALALLALEMASLGVETSDRALLEAAEEAAERAIALQSTLPGHPPWRARALAALTHVRTALPERGDALASAREALEDLRAGESQELFLDIWLPCGRAILRSGSDVEVAAVREHLEAVLGGVAEHTLDVDIRGRWFDTPPQAELVAMAGGMEAVREAFRRSPMAVSFGILPTEHVDLSGHEQELLRLMTEARSDGEIARTLGMSEEQVAHELTGILARLNAPSRSAATAFALIQRLV